MTGTVKHLPPPLSAAAILANDALAPDATKHKADWLAKQASRRWLGEVQRATETMGTYEARRYLAGKSPWSMYARTRP